MVNTSQNIETKGLQINPLNKQSKSAMRTNFDSNENVNNYTDNFFAGSRDFTGQQNKPKTNKIGGSGLDNYHVRALNQLVVSGSQPSQHIGSGLTLPLTTASRMVPDSSGSQSSTQTIGVKPRLRGTVEMMKDGIILPQMNKN